MKKQIIISMLVILLVSTITAVGIVNVIGNRNIDVSKDIETYILNKGYSNFTYNTNCKGNDCLVLVYAIKNNKTVHLGRFNMNISRLTNVQIPQEFDDKLENFMTGLLEKSNHNNTIEGGDITLT